LLLYFAVKLFLLPPRLPDGGQVRHQGRHR
jgi:hypothetical protein